MVEAPAGYRSRYLSHYSFTHLTLTYSQLIFGHTVTNKEQCVSPVLVLFSVFVCFSVFCDLLMTGTSNNCTKYYDECMPKHRLRINFDMTKLSTFASEKSKQ